MHETASVSTTDKSQSVTLAHIDAQDETYILSLREYLESHDVRVVVNSVGAAIPTYAIVAGDVPYVKHIFSRTKKDGRNALGIVVGYRGTDMNLFGKGERVVFADARFLRSEDVLDICDFLFAGTSPVLDLRKGGVANAELLMARAPVLPAISDDARIRAIVADVFGPEPQARKGRRRPKKIWTGAGLFCLGLVIVPVIWYLMSITITGVAINFGAKAIAKGDTGTAAWQADVASYWTAQAKFLLAVSSPIATFVGGQSSVRGQERFVSLLTDTADAESEVSDLSTVARRVASGLLNQVDVTGTGVTSAADITQLRASLATVQNTLGLAQAELSELITDQTFPFSIPFVRQKGTSAVADVSLARQASADMDKLLLLFTQLAGFKEPKNYLILLQNSMELRPTGGFIGSVALASFSDGRLTNLTVDDVYTYDGQLKGHVDPPVPVRDLLGNEHWYLRDSNWDPDFQVAGERAAWFFEKETGTKVDGVIAVSTPFIIEMLRAVGPIDLSDYNDRITADNFYGKALYYTQNNFFPGSTQKKDFLGSLTRALLEKATAGKGVNVTKLFRAITTSLTAHDILFMFTASDVAALTDHFEWSGRVPGTTGCIGTDAATCIFDPSEIVEANMGVNKVNYFVSRTIDRTITVIPDGTRSESTSVLFKNTSTQEPRLPYRAYVRFILPQSSVMGGVAIDGIPVPTKKGSTVTLPYIESSPVASGAFTIGVALDVPAGTQKKLVISYTGSQPLLFGQNGAVFDVYTGKQPGISDTPMHTTILYPAGWTAGIVDPGTVGSSQDFIAKQGQLEYNTILTRDQLTRIRFTKP